jgi:DNA-binding GntR family transcriptional regulator
VIAGMSSPSPLEGLILDGAPQRAPSLAEQAYDTLRRLIISGDLNAGMTLSENEFAKKFSISRSPLREAIRRLQEEGLLDASGPRGFRVPPLTADLVRQVYGVRAALECAAAASADVSPADIVAMRAKMALIRADLDRGVTQSFTDSDFEFHDLFIVNCGNDMLIKQIRRVRNNVARIITFADRFAEHIELSYTEHLVILDALEAHDHEKARAAVQSHVSNVTTRLMGQIESRTS